MSSPFVEYNRLKLEHALFGSISYRRELSGFRDVQRHRRIVGSFVDDMNAQKAPPRGETFEIIRIALEGFSI